MRAEEMQRAPVRTHVVVGQPQQVWAALERAHLDGRLVGVRAVTELADRRVQVTAELREKRRRVLRWRLCWSARTWLLLAAWLLGAAAVVWLVVAAVMALVATVSAGIAAVAAWVSAYWPVLAGGVVALLFLGGKAGAHKCTGLHCGGCQRR